MKERPILFNAEMVRAILDGRKTQTRRPVKTQYATVFWDECGEWCGSNAEDCINDEDAVIIRPPLGIVGDRLWVRETWADVRGMGFDKDLFPVGAGYKADCTSGDSLRCAADYGVKWRPSIHMPRWASRITLEITAVRVERVQDISEEDARKEGVTCPYRGEKCGGYHPEIATVTEPPECVCIDGYKPLFKDLWQSIYGTWDANPWAWVYEFRRVKP